MNGLAAYLGRNESLGSRLAAGCTTGFDYMRLGLSMCVILWHSIYLTPGAQQGLPPQIIVVIKLILPLFFALSGFLVASSLERLQHLPTFGLQRFLRIFPALCVEVLLSALVLGPLLTKVPLHDYFTDPTFFTYFRNLLGWPHYQLPGVFKDHFTSIVNKSLWTVPVELECYILLALAFLLGAFKRTWLLVAALVVLSAACVYEYRDYHFYTKVLIPERVLLTSFLGGNIVFKLRDRLPGGLLAAAVMLALSLVMLTNYYAAMFSALPVAYACAALGCTAPRKAPIIFSGDYSYGLYLYAFPLQQMWIELVGPQQSVAENFALTMLAASAFAAFSWHFIEKPTVRLKHRIMKPRPRLAAAPAE